MRSVVFSFAGLSGSLLCLTLVACGDDTGDEPPVDLGTDLGPDDPDMPVVDLGHDEGVPDLGFDAGPPCDGPPGLYVDPACTVVAEGIESFNPQYWLWSDGTDKQRWIALPEDAPIDTTDPDNWIYPTGTRVWKTFLTPDGETKLETRLLEKVADGVGWDFWEASTYVWNEAQDAVTEVLGGMEDVLGTSHDIPSEAQCLQCHANPGRADVLLGFSAIQLNHGDTDLSLDDLNLRGTLTEMIALSDARVPSDGDSRLAAGLGYLHANCGNCHGGAGAAAGMRLWSDVGTDSFDESGVAMTAVDVSGRDIMGSTIRIDPGSPSTSTIFLRMGSREMGIQMPPLATEIVDEDGLDTVETFIEVLGM
jgi:hypothetical protein